MIEARIKLVVQKRQKFNKEKCLTIKEESHKLVEANYIREIQYLEWLKTLSW